MVSITPTALNWRAGVSEFQIPTEAKGARASRPRGFQFAIAGETPALLSGSARWTSGSWFRTDPSRPSGAVGVLLLIAAGFLFSAAPALADKAEKEIRRGVDLYRKEKFKESAEALKSAAELDKTSGLARYNLGTALAKSGELEEAQAALGEAAEFDNTPSKSAAYYNQGCARVMKAMKPPETPAAAAAAGAPAGPHAGPPAGQGGSDADPLDGQIKDLGSALESFRRAILENPSDRDAKYNFETTRMILDELKKKRDEQKKQDQQGKGDKNKDQKDKDKKDKDQKSDKGDKGDKGDQKGDDKDQDGKKGDQQSKDQQNKDQQGKDRQNKDQAGKDGEQQKKDDPNNPKDGENKPEDKSGESKDQKGKDGKEGKDDSKNGQKQDQGLKPGATPGPDQPQPAEGQDGRQADKQPMSPEQLNAVRVLNSLEKDKPEQFKRLFRFQGKPGQKRERDW